MKKVRGSQQVVKPIEVNVDTVYIRSNIVPVQEEDFTGWEYDEETLTVREYTERLTLDDDTQSMAMLLAMLMSEIDFLRMRVDALEGREQA